MPTRVIVTRPAAQSAKWLGGLRAAGLQALSLPLIEIAPAPDMAPLRQAWTQLESYDAVMFVSANAVEGFFCLHSPDSAGWGAGATKLTRVWATGPGTVAALVRCGVPASQIDAPDGNASQLDSESLWQQVGLQVKSGFRCLIARGGSDASSQQAVAAGADRAGEGRDWLAEAVRARGGIVEFVVTYIRRVPVLQANALALLQVAAADKTVWLFSSSQAIENLRILAAGQSWQMARAVVTHPRIAQAAHEAGFGVVCQSRPALADLVASIESLG